MKDKVSYGVDTNWYWNYSKIYKMSSFKSSRENHAFPTALQPPQEIDEQSQL